MPLNFGNTPAAPTGFTNVVWQYDGTINASAYVPASSASAYTPGSGCLEFTPPPAISTWTWINQSTYQPASIAVQATSPGPICLTVPPSPNGNAWNISGLFLPVPTPPWTYTAYVVCVAPVANSNYSTPGLYLTDQTKFLSLDFLFQNSSANLEVNEWNGISSSRGTTLSSLTTSLETGCWLSIHNDSTNLTFNYSLDGVNFIALQTQPVGSFLTPTEIGFASTCINTSQPAIASLLSWRQS